MTANTRRAVRWSIVVTALLAAGAGAWLLARGRHDEFATLSGHKEGAFCLALSPDGTEVASGGGEGVVRIWDVATKKQKQALTGHAGTILALAWSPDGATLASSAADKSLRLWDVKNATERQIRKNLPSPITGLAFSSDGKILAASLDRVVFHWGNDISSDPARIRAHTMLIAGLGFRPGGHELATYSPDKLVCLWDLDTGEKIADMPGPAGHCHGLAISTDGKLLVCIGGGRAHLFDLEQRRPLEAIEPHARTLYGVAFSPDKRMLALGSEDKVIVIWDLAAKKERARLRGHDYTVGPLAFLPDGHVLITSSYDSTLKLWKVP